jgi:hypothetical protein
MTRALAALAVALAASSSVQAYTPASGFWYNPNESGTGIAIEIEDKLLFMAAYVYDTQGRATWYLSSGNLTPSVVGNSTYYNVFNGNLDGYANGQYIGGPWVRPTYFANAAGPVQIIFNPNDETRATLTWGGRTTQIERLDYYAGFGAADREIERMIGEWSVVVDLYARGGDYAFYPYYGDVLVFDLINRTPNPDFFEGCRADTSLTGRCSNTALQYHDAAGYYDAARDEHVAVVTDAVASGSNPALYWAYYLNVNVSDFEGVVELYFQGETSGDGPYYPVRGFRSGSRSFVLNNGAGPAATEVDPKAAARNAARSVAKQIMAQNGGVMPAGLSAEQVQERYGIDVHAHADKVRELQASLGE